MKRFLYDKANLPYLSLSKRPSFSGTNWKSKFTRVSRDLWLSKSIFLTYLGYSQLQKRSKTMKDICLNSKIMLPNDSLYNITKSGKNLSNFILRKNSAVVIIINRGGRWKLIFSLWSCIFFLCSRKNAKINKINLFCLFLVRKKRIAMHIAASNNLQ